MSVFPSIWRSALPNFFRPNFFYREQAERAAAHNKRLQRYEMIGNKWASSGAGKRQHDKDVAEERRVLAEAAAKEKADADREIVRVVAGAVVVVVIMDVACCCCYRCC